MRDRLPGAAAGRRMLDRAERDLLFARIGEALDGAPGVVFGYVFGSFVTHMPIADLDVAVFLDADNAPTPLHLDAQLGLIARLEGTLHLPVDVVILNDAPVGLKLSAVRGLVAFSRDESARHAFLEQASHQAMDTAFLRRLALRELLGTA